VAEKRPERAAFLEVLFPGRCLLCGTWLAFSGSRGLPLCGACREGLAPPEGPRCATCSTPLAGEREVCTRCREAHFSFQCNHSVFAYAGGVRRLVSAYKFGGRVRLARYFAALLAPVIARDCPGIPVVPVPPRPGRRGRDPVERIARVLEREWGAVVCRCLARTGGTEQKSLDFAGRTENLRGRIALRPPARARGVPLHAVLLDDVFTTGATADACARALLAAGCRSVRVVTLAVD
jgi:competence protein ComFC